MKACIQYMRKLMHIFGCMLGLALFASDAGSYDYNLCTPYYILGIPQNGSSEYSIFLMYDMKEVKEYCENKAWNFYERFESRKSEFYIYDMNGRLCKIMQFKY